MKFLKFFLLTLIIGILIFLFVSQLNQKKEPVIIHMKKDTFEPNNIQIKKGTMVIFKNEDFQARWPASNLHPTHDIYPAFDPQQPIEAGEEWRFVFDKIGSWKFHDHLFPSIRGIITVS